MKLQLSNLKNKIELQLLARVQKGEPQTRFANSDLHPSRKQSIKLVILILHFSHQKTVSVINVDSYCCNGGFTLDVPVQYALVSSLSIIKYFVDFKD